MEEDGWKETDEGIWDRNDNKVLDVRLTVKQILRSTDGEMIADIRWKAPWGEDVRSMMPMEHLSDKRRIDKWALSQGLTPPDSGKGLQLYLRERIVSTIKDGRVVNMHNRFGWTDKRDAFVIGNRRINLEGVKSVRIEGVARDTVQAYSQRGHLSDWKKATEILAKPEYKVHAFVVLAAIATPLLKLMNVSGCVVSLCGQSGYGKSMATMVGLSAFGNWEGSLISPKDTENAITEALRVANNLPIGIDDVSGPLQNEVVPGLVYIAANGKSKNRTDRKGRIQDSERWATVLFMSTNDPLLDMSQRLLKEAERRRIVELAMSKRMTAADGDALNAAISENYGVAAAPIIRMLLDRGGGIGSEAKDMAMALFDSGLVKEANRFGAWLISAARVMGRECYEAGIIGFDPDPPCDEALKSISRHSTVTRSSGETVENILRDYVLEFQSSWTVREGPSKWKKFPEEGQLSVGMLVTDDWAEYDGYLRIPYSKFREYANKYEVSKTVLDNYFRSKNIKSEKLTIAPRATPVSCFKIKIEELGVELWKP